jgi:serine protease
MKSFSTLRVSTLAAALFFSASAIHAADAPKLPGTLVGATQADDGSYDRFIVTYKDGTTERSSSNAALQNVKAAVSRAGLDRATVSSNGSAAVPGVSASYQRKLAIGSDLVSTSRKLNQSEVKALMAQIAADPAVAHVQPDYVMHPVKDIPAPSVTNAKAKATPQAFTPDDPLYAQYQWHFSNPIGGANINNAWDIADGNGVTVAVIDTGVTEHPDIDTSLADVGYDFLSLASYSGRDADGRVKGGWDTGDWTTAGQCSPTWQAENSSWHGTHVSGTALERTNNGEGMAGIAYNAQLLPIRALGHCGGPTADIADAIVWAAGGHVDGVPDNTHPAQVINMSLGGSGSCPADSPFGQAIQYAISRGTTVVVAAGNDGQDVSNSTPANCQGVIAVASNGITGKRAFYSNYGSGVTIAAPGGGIYENDASSGNRANPDGFVWSAINDGTTSPGNPTYGGYAGTSQATPHVAGTVAMIVGAREAAGLPALSPAEIKTVLTNSARPFPVALDHPIGAGILDANAAVNLALGNDNGGDPNPGDPNATPLTKGVLVSGVTGAANGILYSIDVPAGAKTLNIRTLGGSGSVALYVKTDSAPAGDGSNADYRSSKPGTSQAVVIQQPQATTYYIRVASPSTYTNISVLADYSL